MGSPKALLTVQGRTFLEGVIESLIGGGCAPLIVVTGPAEYPGSSKITAKARALGATTLVNPDPASDQIESLRIALAQLPPKLAGIIMTPVDAPGVTRSVVSMLARSADEGAAIVVPTHEGRRGHPVFFGRKVLPELAEGVLPEGARTILHRYRSEVVEVPVEDAAILFDIDTPADYQRLLELHR